MDKSARFGTVIFAANHRRLADFYAAVANLHVQLTDDTVAVLQSEGYELVIHRLAGEPEGVPASPRQDGYIKPFFPVADLALARRRVTAFGGQADPPDQEWAARGFRACEAIDPEGNAIQFRQAAA